MQEEKEIILEFIRQFKEEWIELTVEQRRTFVLEAVTFIVAICLLLLLFQYAVSRIRVIGKKCILKCFILDFTFSIFIYVSMWWNFYCMEIENCIAQRLSRLPVFIICELFCINVMLRNIRQGKYIGEYYHREYPTGVAVIKNKELD